MNWVTLLSWAMMWFACVANVLGLVRSIRSIRTNQALRQIIWAYLKELQERGVTLPPRCIHCCQILPRHVDGCDFAEFQDWFMKLMARPTIKYYPDGSKPPGLGGSA
jgi:hypothetical protein